MFFLDLRDPFLLLFVEEFVGKLLGHFIRTGEENCEWPRNWQW